MVKSGITAVILIVVSFALQGCNPVRTMSSFNIPVSSRTPIMIGEVTDETGDYFGDIRPAQILKKALALVLKGEDILYESGEMTHLVMDVALVEYQQGNAMKRLLVPGWGATIVKVSCTLKTDDGAVVGKIDIDRSVTVAFTHITTVDAWRTIFKDVAEDIAQEIHKETISGRLRGQPSVRWLIPARDSG